MKKILILAYDFPPYPSVGGLRPAVWLKYLKEFGVEPIIITRQWSTITGHSTDYIQAGNSSETVLEELPSGRIYKAPYLPSLSNKLLLKHGENRFQLIRKINSGSLEIAQFFLPVGTKYTLYKCADQFLKTEKVDAIIATGDPFILFHYANKLSKTHKTPWIADYRDPWSHYIEHQGGWFYHFSKNREKTIVSNANHIITVSEIIGKKIQQLVGKIPFTTIENGYDSDLINHSAHIQQNGTCFTIAHAGTIYDWHPLEQFLDGVSIWKKNHPTINFRLIFYGLNQVERLNHLLDTDYQHLKHFISYTGRIPNNEMIPILCESNVMLMFNYYAYMGTKIYDYLGIKRKILLCFENDEEALLLKKKHYHFDESENPPHLQVETIHKTNSGIVVKDKFELPIVLEELYDEFIANGNVSCNAINIEKYSRKEQVRQLAELIKTNF